MLERQRSLADFGSRLARWILYLLAFPPVFWLKAVDAEPPGPGLKENEPEVEDVQRVIPKEKKKVSPLLRPPSTDRYDPLGIDWSEIPEWRRASFFGIRAKGQFFIYVVDGSGSMDAEDRISRAKAEVRKSVAELRQPQRFRVIFYNEAPIPMPPDVSFSADLISREKLLQWLRIIEPDGGTDPRSSLRLAISYRPDAIFLLSDGEYPEGTADAIRSKNPQKIPIHCIDLSGGEAGPQLKQIAQESGGQYASRPSTMPR